MPPPATPEVPSSSPVVVLRRRHLGLVALIVGLPWAVVLLAVFQLRSALPPREAAPSPAGGNAVASPAATDLPAVVAGDGQPVQIGPWGQLELTRVIIEPPDDLITIDARRVDSVLWHFPGYAEREVESVFAAAPLSDDQRARLNDRQTWQLLHDRITVRVPKALILELDPDSRRRIYAVLSPFRENSGQWAPASFRAESANDWFSGSGLTEHTVGLVQPLLYRRGESLLFSDLELIAADVKTQRQRLLLLRTLARSTTQFARLRINNDTDIAALAEYWSLGQRNRDITPLLKSIPRDGRGFSIDIVHLLPPVARRLLYTYDSPPPAGQEAFRDCHWTALNFANRDFDDRFRDLELVRDAYQSKYLPVTDEPRLGDVFLFVTEGEIVLHASVHIAGDLVFTKNGAWAAAPWILMRMPDLIALYPSDTPLDIRHLRKKNGD